MNHFFSLKLTFRSFKIVFKHFILEGIKGVACSDDGEVYYFQNPDILKLRFPDLLLDKVISQHTADECMFKGFYLH